ncbi:MAG: DUF2911 domain-containing protein [Opitutus sp.]|nr:DUF2911 domain-containing protein [Opitutus sp.]
MTRFKFIALFTAALFGATSLVAQEKKAKKVRPSLPATVTADIDGNEVKIAYSRPGAKNPKGGEVRKIWGELVPYGKVWRTGANEATLLTTQKPIVIGGYSLAAGTYSLFTVPQSDGSAKLIINKKTGQWGIPYKEEEEKANELARVDLKKGKTEGNIDPFTMAVEKTGAGAGVIKMAWEDTQYSVAFTNKK